MLLDICHPLEVLGGAAWTWKSSVYSSSLLTCQLVQSQPLLPVEKRLLFPSPSFDGKRSWGPFKPGEAQMMGVSLSKSIMVMEGVIYVFFILFFVRMGC